MGKASGTAKRVHWADSVKPHDGLGPVMSKSANGSVKKLLYIKPANGQKHLTRQAVKQYIAQKKEDEAISIILSSMCEVKEPQ